MSQDFKLSDVKRYLDPALIQRFYPNISFDDAIFVRDLLWELSHTVYFELSIKKKIRLLKNLLPEPKTNFLEIAMIGVLNSIVELL